MIWHQHIQKSQDHNPLPFQLLLRPHVLCVDTTALRSWIVHSDSDDTQEEGGSENPSGASPAFPAFNQQCQDDAGPRWLADLETFGPDNFYWSDSHARAVLNQDGTCPTPVEVACQTRKNPLQAFVEGPISCPDAWACRIYPDPNHGSGYDFLGDRNFGNCDRPDTDLWEATMTDQDGHCHGGLDPSSYYWWVRDHWNRPYSGRVKCCCVESKEIGNTGRRTMNLDGVANRCDYRAKVTVDVNECRDANEDHAGGRMGSGFLYGYDGPGGFGETEGCPRTADGKVAYTREPADEMCWEILNFGLPDANDNDPTIFESSTGPCSGAGSATGGSCDGIEAFSGQFSGPDAPQYVRPAGAGPFTPIPTLPSNTNLPEVTTGPSDSSSTTSASACFDDDEAAVEMAMDYDLAISGCADAISYCEENSTLAQICPITCGMCQEEIDLETPISESGSLVLLDSMLLFTIAPWIPFVMPVFVRAA
eukprot:TRINITY_DN367_c0_g1_i10.p1 TRINITY_DN367_c0_g1~~TRINITY_DN367_c0_g1_i10.p1  ORF type:complete len:478 (+),score=82.66 TRINITY_DN367_c0_g1_i10:579-2012(+)